MSELKACPQNDDNLFPSHMLTKLAPILTLDGLKEFFMDKIIDSHKVGYRWCFLICWLGYSLEHDLWIASSELNNCKALNSWYKNGRDSSDVQ
jgi:hypothetical protein